VGCVLSRNQHSTDHTDEEVVHTVVSKEHSRKTLKVL